MSARREIPAKAALEEVAEKNGVAVAVVDASGVEVAAVNNNSICASLNPDGEFTRDCFEFCGRALQRASANGGRAAYTCHAGLECRSAALHLDGKPAAVITGRAFLRSENYRKAGERAISGDWKVFPPAQFFENILLSGSATIVDEALDDVIKRSVEITEPEPQVEVERPKPAPAAGEAVQTAAAEWRAFLGSLLLRDHSSARNGMIEFLASHFGLKYLVWLEKRGDRLESTAVSASLRDRRVRLGMPAGDERLRDAATTEMPVELGERPTPEKRQPQRMLLFALPVGDEIPAALVILDSVESPETRRQIAKLCAAVAPQLEILRLRSEMNRRRKLDEASRKMTEGMRDIDSDEFWTHLAQVSAELLQAERASLMTRQEDGDELEIKAAVGTPNDLRKEKNVGERVARIVFEKGKPIVVSDVSSTGLPPADAERRYKTGSFLSAPLSFAGRQVAVINFTDKASGGTFDRRDLEMVRAITPQLASAIDRTQLKEKAGEFQTLSVTDPLTGLLNRRYLEQRLTEEAKRSLRTGQPMSVIMLDVDHFKSYNDTYGHPAGDEALRLVAHVIRETLRDADVAARFGGEEFAILLPTTTDEEAATIAERVRHNIATTQFPHREVTVSMGVASCSSELCVSLDMIAAADKALYEAKADGRNRVRIYQEMMERQAV